MEEFSDVPASCKQLPASIKQGTPMDEELEELGQRIAGDWEKLGRRLDINDAKLQEIHEAHNQLSEKGYQMLKHWKQRKGSAAIYQVLHDALQNNLVQRQDLAEQFCYIHGTDPVPEEKETGKIPVATAATCGIGALRIDQEDSSRVRSRLKRKRLKPNPKRGNLSLKIRCANAISRNSHMQDPQQARKTVDSYMGEKVDEGKRTFDLYSHKGLKDFYAYLRGHLDILIESSENSSIKITVKCRTLEILERLMVDYRSGHLNAKAEEYLITEKVKDELDMETITLTTTILEEDYLACKLSLMEISVEASADDGQMESRECKLEELQEPTDEASAGDGQVERRGDLESRELELEELEEPTDGPSAVTRTGSASGFKALTEDQLLKHDRITVEIAVDNRPSAINDDADSSSDEAPPAQPVPSPPSPPVIPSAISTPAAQNVAYHNLPACRHKPREGTYPDPAIDLPASGNDSDTGPSPRRSTRVRRRPARYNDFVLDSYGLTSVDASADVGQVELRGDLELRDKAGTDDRRVERRGDLETKEDEFEELEEPTAFTEEELLKLGARHVDVECTDTGLGDVKHDRGELQQAKELYERALDVGLKKLGPDHVDVASTYLTLGNLHYDLDDLQQAKENFERALDIQLKKLGPDHVDVATSYNNLANVQRDLGELQQAKENYERALDIRLRKLGPDHVDVALSYNNLAIVQHDLGDLQRAKENYERALDIWLKKLGPDHVDVATSYNNLASVQRGLGDLQQAKKLHERALDIRLRKLGPEHVDVATSYNNLAIVQHDLGDLQRAKENNERALDISLKKLGPETTVQHDLGDLQQAKKLHERALDIRLRKLGPEHVDVATSYNNLATVQHDLGDLQQAKKLHERALDIRLRKLGPDHVDVATSYNNLATVQRDLGELQQAKDLHERALDICLKKLGPEHVDVATTYDNLGVLLCDLGDLQQAKENFDSALDIRLRKLGPYHVDVARTKKNLAAVQRDMAAVQRDLGDLQQGKKPQLLDIGQKKLEPELEPEDVDVDVAQTDIELVVGHRDLSNVKQAKRTSGKCSIH
ncbi:hypothetical protein ACROYT_G020280 [Oculina patagonica]